MKPRIDMMTRIGLGLPLVMWLPVVLMRTIAASSAVNPIYFLTNLLSVASMVLVIFGKADPIAKQGIVIGILINYVLLLNSISQRVV